MRGNGLTLRDPATNTAIVQRIESHEPGRFSVVDAASGGTASFGCTNVGEYRFEQGDGGTLHVQEVADTCLARVEILVAGSWDRRAPGVDCQPAEPGGHGRADHFPGAVTVTLPA